MPNDIHWIKITTDMFDDEKIRIIEKMPDGDTILIIWIKLLTLTGRVNAGGYILLTESIPYTDEMLSTIFDRPLMTVQLALKTFEKFNMLHLDRGTMVISNWDKHQNIEALDKIREQTRLRVQKCRSKQVTSATASLQVTVGNGTELELEKEIEQELEGGISLPELPDCFKVYEQEIGMLTPMIAEELKDIMKTYPEEWVLDAMKEASRANKRSLRYVNGILKSWQREGRNIQVEELSPEEKALLPPKLINRSFITNKIYRHAVSKGGDRAGLIDEVRNRVLVLEREGKTMKEIFALEGIEYEVETVSA